MLQDSNGKTNRPAEHEYPPDSDLVSRIGLSAATSEAPEYLSRHYDRMAEFGGSALRATTPCDARRILDMSWHGVCNSSQAVGSRFFG
jgi:hypothetical protein